jgi:hypothetical protein
MSSRVPPTIASCLLSTVTGGLYGRRRKPLPWPREWGERPLCSQDGKVCGDAEVMRQVNAIGPHPVLGRLRPMDQLSGDRYARYWRKSD